MDTLKFHSNILSLNAKDNELIIQSRDGGILKVDLNGMKIQNVVNVPSYGFCKIALHESRKFIAFVDDGKVYSIL